ncbi:MAG: hypothetical protein LBG28_01740, partial [Tannerella sp.]|nr:hypothetical protein [Tannerella sp.]
WQKSAFLLDGCRKVLVKDNTIDPQYTTRSLLIEHMKKSDVKGDKSFPVDFVPGGMKTYLE